MSEWMFKLLVLTSYALRDERRWGAGWLEYDRPFFSDIATRQTFRISDYIRRLEALKV